ncbi:MAG: hypothetical protein KC613_01155 [Myxococcales bacterium]|nr:hypothetical protein [Myxococcales bacterium]MCB9522259.1 hypothetical protein [Myxococcales bacterium]
MSERPKRGPLGQAYRLFYWIFAVGLLLSISLSVTWHVMGPSADAGTVSGLDRPACARAARALNTELHAQASSLLAEPVPEPEIGAMWKTWSTGWHGRMRQLRGRCPVQDDPALGQLLDDVERMHLAWTTALHSFVQVGRRPMGRLNAQFAEVSADR